MTIRRLATQLLALLRGRRLDAEFDDEVAAHLELAEKDALESGLPPDQARRTARLHFGAVESIREEHRDSRSARWLETFWRDVRYGFASILRDPGFATVSIGVLALGIGANTAMFSLVDATMLKPVPFPHPERMVRVWEAPPGSINGFNTLDFLDWKRLNTVFEALAAVRSEGLAMTGEGDPVRLSGNLVSADYFEAFGVSAALGRTFAPGEDAPGAAPVALLSHASWQTRFGGDPGILNREISLDGRAHAIIGVLPPGPFDRADAEIWKPLVFSPSQMNRGFHWLQSVGRLKPGVTLEQAQQEMSAIDASLTDLTPDWKKDWGVLVEPYDKRLLGDSLRRSIPVAFGAVTLVLLIACANVANLLLAKGAVRSREMAVRAALGASRARLAVQLLTESLVVCVLGGLAGVALAQLLIRAAMPLVAASLPFTAEIRLDPRVLGFTAAATLGVALLVGLLPSFRTSFARLSEAMNQGSRGASRSGDGLRRAIVVGEVGVSLVLICGAALLFKSLAMLQQVDTGARVDSILTMSANLPKSVYPTPSSAVRFYRDAAERLGSTPGVDQVSFSTDLPLEGVRQGQGIEGVGGMRYKRVDARYFALLDIPLLEGRGIEERDVEGAPNVMVVNEELADLIREQLDLASPVGRVVKVATPNYENSDGSAVDVQIVGVIRSEHTGALAEGPELVAYVPLAQVPRMDLKIVVRSQAQPEALMPGIREAVRQVDPNLPLGSIRTMQQIRDRGLRGAKQPTWVIGSFALTAAFLAALGLYGVLSHMVAQQRREIGIRMALGAQSGDVLSQVLGSAGRMIGVGLALGLGGAFALTQVIQSLLFQISALDPYAIAAACAATVMVGLAAGAIPARRAARVQPMNVLREEA